MTGRCDECGSCEDEVDTCMQCKSKVVCRRCEHLLGDALFCTDCERDFLKGFNEAMQNRVHDDTEPPF